MLIKMNNLEMIWLFEGLRLFITVCATVLCAKIILGFDLSLTDLPRVKLSLGSTLDPDGIKEGDDVYFECSIDAKPSVYKIVWKI